MLQSILIIYFVYPAEGFEYIAIKYTILGIYICMESNVMEYANKYLHNAVA